MGFYDFLTVLLAIAGIKIAYFSVTTSKKIYRLKYINLVNIKESSFETKYYGLIEKLLFYANVIFGKAISIRSVFVSITWALLYSSIIFFISWLLFGVEAFGNTIISNIQLEQVIRTFIGIAFILSIILTLAYFKKNLESTLANRLNLVLYNLYDRLNISNLKNGLVFSRIGDIISKLISLTVFIIFTGIFFVASWFFSVAIALSFYLSILILFVIYQYDTNENNGLLQWFVKAIILTLLVAAFLSLTGNYPVLIFVFIFPFINGIYDWLSLSLSRYFGFLITHKKSIDFTFYLIVFDLIFAYLFLISITLSLVSILELVNSSNQTSLQPFPIQEIVSLVQNEPFTGGFWILFMLFSTLIPTYIHLFVACVHFIFIKTPKWLKKTIIENLESNGPYGTSIVFLTCYFLTAAIFPLVLLFVIFQIHVFSLPSISDNLFILIDLVLNLSVK